MVSFGRFQFEMNWRDKDGATLRQHLESDAYGLIPNPASLARLMSEPPLPPGCTDVWAVFLSLHARRPHGEFGPLRLPWSELQAYERVAGVHLGHWQVKAIFALEDAYFAVRAENEK